MKIRGWVSVCIALAVPFSGIAASMEFSDVPSGAWFALAVHTAASAGIVSGYKNAQGMPTGMFGPGDNVTVAQALKISVLASGYEPGPYLSSCSRCSRAYGDQWYAPYVAVAQSEGFIGLDVDAASLNAPAQRIVVASIIAGAFRVSPAETTGTFSDLHAGSAGATSVEALARDGVVSGDTNASGQPTGKFRPLDSVNRAEAVKMVMGALHVYGNAGSGRQPAPAVSSAAAEQTSSSTAAAQSTDVHYTNDGFVPPELHVKVGTTVTFTNDISSAIWVASNPHPVHTDLSGFDEKGTISTGGSYQYTFTKVGNWGYHNHLSASHTGLIVVEP